MPAPQAPARRLEEGRRERRARRQRTIRTDRQEGFRRVRLHRQTPRAARLRADRRQHHHLPDHVPDPGRSGLPAGRQERDAATRRRDPRRTWSEQTHLRPVRPLRRPPRARQLRRVVPVRAAGPADAAGRDPQHRSARRRGRPDRVAGHPARRLLGLAPVHHLGQHADHGGADHLGHPRVRAGGIHAVLLRGLPGHPAVLRHGRQHVPLGHPGRLEQPLAPHPAGRDPGHHRGRLHLVHAARLHARSHPLRLRAHGPGQGAARALGHSQAQPQERPHPGA